MVEIVFTTRGGNNSFNAPTAKESINGFLAKYKNRQIYIMEYHDGKFTIEIDIGGLTGNQLYKKFNSRNDAKNFADSL